MDRPLVVSRDHSDHVSRSALARSEAERLRKEPTAWAYLPQLYENTPYERYRFETYENIIRGSVGSEMIQGIGDASFNRGLAGELRYLHGGATVHSASFDSETIGYWTKVQ